MFDLSGKTILLTGASGGIGNAVARVCHAQGAHLVISGTREEALQTLASELKDRVDILPCNLTDQEQVAGLIDQAEKMAEKIDILVCNAGVTKDNLALRMNMEDWQAVLDINLTSTFQLNKAAFKKMMKRKWGRIINISSVVAFSGNPGQANYVAAKAGMVGMSKSLAVEFAARNVTVNCIAPGFIKTKMTDVLPDEQKESLLSSIPLGRLGASEDIANACVYLASDEASYVTGQTIHVNGGMLRV